MKSLISVYKLKTFEIFLRKYVSFAKGNRGRFFTFFHVCPSGMPKKQQNLGHCSKEGLPTNQCQYLGHLNLGNCFWYLYSPTLHLFRNFYDKSGFFSIESRLHLITKIWQMCWMYSNLWQMSLFKRQLTLANSF